MNIRFAVKSVGVGFLVAGHRFHSLVSRENGPSRVFRILCARRWPKRSTLRRARIRECEERRNRVVFNSTEFEAARHEAAGFDFGEIRALLHEFWRNDSVTFAP